MWTLFDYFGEPYGHAWPHVASSYGSYDVAGFPKAAVFWYRALWLSGIAPDAADRPPLKMQHTVHIVQDNDRMSRMVDPENGTAVNTIQIYSSCPTVELLVNGISMGKQDVARYMWAEYNFPFTPGNLTAVGYSAPGIIGATHTVATAGKAVKVMVSVDVPSVATGTGTKLLLDGQDVGLLRAEVVDAAGRVVPSATHNITFAVLSGQGRIIGVGNGDPTNHQPNTVAWRDAFHGLARGLVQVTANAASDDRDMLLEVDTDPNLQNSIIIPSHVVPTMAPIVVQASSPGLESSTVAIPVSADLGADGVLAVASRSVEVAVTGK